MTSKQEKHFYWPLWNRACKRNAWRMQNGCLTLAENAPDPANTVIETARRLADQAHRAVTLNDLRHATHFVAAGRDCGHAQLKNKELTRWIWLVKLLIDPDDLDAMNHWLHPELDEQESAEARIARVPEAYVARICRGISRGETEDWRALDAHARRTLLIALSNRSEHFKKPFAAPKERVGA
jgi:hypothetical protein